MKFTTTIENHHGAKDALSSPPLMSSTSSPLLPQSDSNRLHWTFFVLLFISFVLLFLWYVCRGCHFVWSLCSQSQHSEDEDVDPLLSDIQLQEGGPGTAGESDQETRVCFVGLTRYVFNRKCCFLQVRNNAFPITSPEVSDQLITAVDIVNDSAGEGGSREGFNPQLVKNELSDVVHAPNISSFNNNNHIVKNGPQLDQIDTDEGLPHHEQRVAERCKGEASSANGSATASPMAFHHAEGAPVPLFPSPQPSNDLLHGSFHTPNLGEESDLRCLVEDPHKNGVFVAGEGPRLACAGYSLTRPRRRGYAEPWQPVACVPPSSSSGGGCGEVTTAKVADIYRNNLVNTSIEEEISGSGESSNDPSSSSLPPRNSFNVHDSGDPYIEEVNYLDDELVLSDDALPSYYPRMRGSTLNENLYHVISHP
ncbi:unnamed protein product [Phytomonas sp. EM1]|nr:unnamed protein product [Phytomonas sp. EM1]|eukprot:CCW62090.1 unnamed protein product [Phytomonas sp. isolate EM1]